MEYIFGLHAAGGCGVPAAFVYAPGTGRDHAPAETAGRTGDAESAGQMGVCDAANGTLSASADMPRTRRFGFLTEENRKRYPRLGIAELNDGFAPVYWAKNFIHTRVRQDAFGCYMGWDGEGEIPLTFACDVPCEGNYEVTVTLYAKKDMQALLFLGRRRLAARVSLKGGEFWSGSFLTNICPIIPRGFAEPMDDTTLDVTVVGAGVHLYKVDIRPWQGPVVYIAGDSTLTDQSADYPYLPGSSYCGWGQMLSAYVGKRFPVSNHAHSGLTTESFREEGHYAILFDRIKKGDLCLIQFGHNDQKLMHLLADGGYKENLNRYITELLGKGALPALVTPLARNSWMGGSGAYNDLLADYARVCREVGRARGIPVLDLHERSMAFVKEQGREAAKRYFFPSDYTHSNDYGAYLFAGFVFEELIEKHVLEAGMEVSDFGEPRNASALPGAWEPPQVLPVLSVPEEYAHMENPADEHLFENLERPQDILTRAEALELVVTAMHFFPTNVYNDMFTDVVGHETYAGTVECAWQNGLIPEELVNGNRLEPLREVDGKTFLRILLNGYATRKDLPEGENDLAVARALGILPDDFDEGALLTRRMAAQLCKGLPI